MAVNMIKLRSCRDPHQEVQISMQGLQIGRSTTNQLVLQNKQVSRQHAVIRYENDVPVLTDMNSGVGTFVNNQRIQRTILHPGDLIAFGPEQWQVETYTNADMPIPVSPPGGQSKKANAPARMKVPTWAVILALGGGLFVILLALAVVLVFSKDARSQPRSYSDIQPAVIQIIAEGTYAEPEGTDYNAGWSGTGFIIDPSGIAVTNNHVVTGAALLKVMIGGDPLRTYNARVLGVSECSDLAVIDIEGDGFPYLNWSDEPVKIGMEVYAAGYPLGEPEFTLTRGIISKEDVTNNSTNWASVPHVIMHDAQINPGNSGGPLVDMSGTVVGVNYRGNTANQYFAIGSDLALEVVSKLRTGKDLDTLGINGRADLTVYTDEDENEIPLPGLWVSSVKSGSPADRIGIKSGDIILQMENVFLVPVTDQDTVDTVREKLTMEKYCSILRSHNSTDQLAVTVVRIVDGQPVILEGKINGSPLAEQ